MNKGSHKHQFRWSLFFALMGGFALAIEGFVTLPHAELCTRLAAGCYFIGMVLFLGAKLSERREARETMKPVEAKPSK